jgi:hypothetical protein
LHSLCIHALPHGAHLDRSRRLFLKVFIESIFRNTSAEDPMSVHERRDRDRQRERERQADRQRDRERQRGRPRVR